MLKKIGHYIDDQNQTVYVPRGLMLVDPVERGLRVVSFDMITVFNRNIEQYHYCTLQYFTYLGITRPCFGSHFLPWNFTKEL